MRDEATAGGRRTIRAAIYTRKSSDEGLDQAFNSLDAQHEACAAYIASQRHEGWRALSARYDDGGISGGTLERPAIQRLLGEIDAGRVDMVVVYKIDRLTRSLADFARLVERFDRVGCSFVSVTQAFNTATSMGRLTLNVLLSFAQFEREVTGERIRDKIAASKKKGLWMGGLPPLGYDVKRDATSRALIRNAEEAAIVRKLFELYDHHETLREVRDAAERLGLRSKHRRFASGRTSGGSVMSSGQIQHVLRNPIYVGRIRHKDQHHPGQHEAIIDPELWERVQAKLRTRAGRRRVRDTETGALREPRSRSPLAGRIFDETGDRLTASHSQRRGRRHRYFVSNRLIARKTREQDPTGWRLAADELERAVAEAITTHLGTLQERILVEKAHAEVRKLQSSLEPLLTRLRQADPSTLRELVAKIRIAPGEMAIEVAQQGIAAALVVSINALDPDALNLTAPFQLRRRGVEQKIVSGKFKRAPDETLVRTIALAHQWLGALRGGASMAEIAKGCGRNQCSIRQRIALALLAPQITEAILDGRQPPELTLKTLLMTDLPLCWSAQAKVLGFES